MALDVNEFISEALKEGHSIDDVVGFMSSHKNEGYRNWATNWSNTASAPEYKTGNADQRIEFENEKERLRQEYEDKLKSSTTTNVLGVDVPSILTGPATGIAGAAGAAALGAYGATKLKNRSIKNPQVAEVVGDVAKERLNPYHSPESMFETPSQAVQETTANPEQTRIAKQQAAIKAMQPGAVAPPTIAPQFSPAGIPAGDIPPAPPYQQIEGQAGAAVAPVTTKTRAPRRSPDQMVSPPALTPEGQVQTIARDAAGKPIWPEGMSPAGRTAAESFAQYYPEHAAALAKEGRFGLLGGGAADTHLYNSYGNEMRKSILNQVNRGELGGVYSNYTDVINPAVKRLPAETGLGKELADLRISNPKGAQHGYMGDLAAVSSENLTRTPATISKALKAGGKTALLMAFADAALAKTPTERANAGTNILNAVLPPSMSINDVGAGSTLSPEMRSYQENAFKLGSPYAQTEEAKKARLKEKAGAGRGIAPPSAYQR
jgi:hypothetical protein